MANKKDLNDIIDTLIAEGIGEGKEGMRRIAETIINRSEQRGLTPAQVVRQRKQYTGYANPGPDAKRAQNTKEARTAAEAAWQLAQGPEDPTGGANFYFNPDLAKPAWAKDMTPTGQYGGHAFYTDRSPSSIIPQVTPQTQSEDMRLMRNPAMSPSARGSATDFMVNNSSSPAPSALQAALNARVQRVAPTPASEEDRVNARMNAVMRTPLPSPVTASDRARGNINVGVGLPQKMAGGTSVDGMYAGIIPNPISPVPASADERLMARMSPQPTARAIIPSSNIEREAARTPFISSSVIERDVARVPDQTLTPRAQAMVSASDLARGRTGTSPYGNGDPFVDAATAAKQVAQSRLPPSEANPPALYGYSALAAPGAPVPIPTIPRQTALAPQVAEVPLPRSRPMFTPTPLNDVARITPAAPLTQTPMGGINAVTPDQNLGPVNNWLGQANPVPNSINIATGSPAPLGRIQRKGFLPGVDLPGLPGMIQDISTAAANSSGTLNNGFDNLLQRTMRGPTSTAPVQFVGTNGYNYGRDNTGRIVNLGSSQPNLSPAQLYESKLTRSKPTTEDKVTGRASSGSFYGL